MKFRFSLAALILAILVSAAPRMAQFTTVNLGGRVVDATGASAPQATVTVLNKDTGFTRIDMTGRNVRVSGAADRSLLDPDRGAHPRVNAALEFVHALGQIVQLRTLAGS